MKNITYNKILSKFFTCCILFLVCVVLQPLNYLGMDFAELHHETDCDWISSASQNCIDFFARKVGASENGMKDKYFRLQKKYRDATFIDCEGHCGNKSISIDIWNDDSKEFLSGMSHNLTIGIAPEFRKQLLIFKVKQYGGLVKHTPLLSNKYHHDYYKPDSFDVNKCLEHITTVKITYHDV